MTGGVVSLVIVCWMGLGAQVASLSHEDPNVKLLGTDGCLCPNDTLLIDTNVPEE